ncbi:MAG: translocation/assembly module TamB domain-containing protein, partial [Gammaproteobacteria bacterium]
MSALRTIATLLGALMILSVLGLLVIGTPSGSAWLVGALADLAGDRLHMSGVRGTLLEGLSVDRFQVVAGRTSIVIEPAELRMNWPDVFRRRIHLTTARADTVRIDIAPRPPDAPKSVVKPLLLPVTIAMDALEIRRLVIRNGVLAKGSSTNEIAPVEIGPVALRGELAGGDLHFEYLRAELYGLHLDADGSFGTGEPFALNARLAWQLTDPAVTGAGRLTGNLAALRFEQVVRLPSPVGVGGVLRVLDDHPQVFAEARWTDFQRRLGKPSGQAAGEDAGEDAGMLLRSASGRLALRGWTDRFTANLDSALQIDDQPEVHARANFEGDTRTILVRELRLDGLGGQMTGTGRLSLGEMLSGNLRVEGRRLDPRVIDPRFPGRVDFRGDLSFDAAGNFRAVLPEASGTLFNRPLRASGTVARQEGLLTAENVRIQAGVNRLELNGEWGDRIAGRFRIDAPDLATLWPAYRGQLRGTGQFAGTAREPQLDLDLEGSDLATGDLRLGTLRAKGGLAARQRLTLDIAARDLVYAGRPLGDLAVAVTGRPDAHSASVRLDGGEVAVDLRTTGSYRNSVLTETVGTGTVTVPGAQRWVLREPATVRLAGPDASVTAHCWTARDAELCLADSHAGSRAFNVGLDLRHFLLASLSPWLPAGIAIAGSATGSLAVEGDPRDVSHTLHGKVQASLAEAVITWHVPDDEDVQTTFREFRVNAGLTGDLLEFEGAVAESFGLHLTTTGRVTDPLGPSPVINATVNGGVPDLASLGPVLERLVDVGDVQGRITLAATLSGNARRPDITGGLELEDGAFTVPAAGIRVDRIGLSLLGREDGQVTVKGNARSGKGSVALDGTLDWRDQLLPSAEATVKGRVFDVINLPEGNVQVSPDVRVVLRDGQFRVGGEMLVPRAEIRLKKIAQSAVQTSPDTVVHGRDLVAGQEKAPPLFVLDGLQVRLGEKVSFEGFGLKTGLTGGLRLDQSLAADPTLVTGSGVVTLRNGQFSAFGQKLAIERGSLIFSGVVTDPGLDVKASRDVDYEGREVTVGVFLTGTVSRIQTRVFSEPAMGELDALSYLTTGKPLSAAGAGDRSAVANSAISLGLTQALPVAQQLGSALSVDEVGLDTTDSGSTAVVVGEKLGKNLFIRYSYGIFDKLGTVQA